jgi:hypothetical protein
MDFAPDKVRARFHELTAQYNKLDDELNPLRAELDSLTHSETLSVVAARAREEELRPKIKALMEKMVPIEAERALCARALGGNTGKPE